MNSKERVLCSLNWQQSDRVPVELYLTPEMKIKLNAYLGCENIYEFLGTDFRRIAPVYTGSRKAQNKNTVKITTSSGATYTESASFPLAEVKTIEELEDYQWPWWSNPDDYDYSVIPALAEANKKYAVSIGGEGTPDILNGLSSLRGMEQVMIDVALRDEVGLKIIDKFVEMKYEQVKRSFEAAGRGKIDILRMGEDCGNQNGRMFSEKDFNEVFRPKLQMFIDLAHEYGAKVMLHCCGDTHELMPAFMEMNIDILDAMQPEPPGMARIEELRNMCKNKMAFCGLISTQRTLPYGTVNDCRKEARNILDVIAPGGGYIFAPAHCIQPDTPVENTLAIYEEALGIKLIKQKKRPHAVKQKISNVLAPAKTGTVKLKGFLGSRIDMLIKNSVMAQDIERIVRPFREKAEDGGCDWRIEYWGKWYTAAALACGYKPTAGHMKVLQKGLRELLATQDPDGYIGTRKKERRLKGWDVWGRKYVLLGLLAYYDLNKNNTVLKAACRHTDRLIAECGPGKTNIAAIGYKHWKGLPPSSVLEPVVLLYKHTGNNKYLDFAEYIVNMWSKPNHWSPNGLRLVEDAIAGVPPSQIGKAPKAYEMMSCYEGLCELYRITGNNKYLQASTKLAEGIFSDELTIIGTGSADELWCNTKNKQCCAGALGMETCVTATWMKFCAQLLRLTGEQKYADALETGTYNALLGALAPAGQWWSYYTLPAGERVPSHRQHADVGTSCCVLSGPRAMLLTPHWAVMTDKYGVVLNLYNQSTANVQLPSGSDVCVIQSTDYPAGDTSTIRIKLQKSESFTFSLRIPDWSKNTSLRINGHTANTKITPGEYTRIHRKWADSDTIELKLDMRGRVISDPAGGDFIALMRGPLVLVLDSRLCPAAPGAGLRIAANADGYVPLIHNPQAAEKYGLWMAFDADFTTPDGSKKTLTLCDFASGGNTWDEKSLYRIWLAQPLDTNTVWDNIPAWWEDTLVEKARPKLPWT